MKDDDKIRSTTIAAVGFGCVFLTVTLMEAAIRGKQTQAIKDLSELLGKIGRSR